jgi:hypothetical protein
MRVALLTGIAAAALALAAPAATVAGTADLDPRSLVLRQTDVPAGFQPDRNGSGVRSNAEESAGQPEVRRIIARSGRITGYKAVFDKTAAAQLESSAAVHRKPAGASLLFDWLDRQVRNSGLSGLRRAPVRIGAAGWVYTGPSPSAFVIVLWRYDRVFAGVVTRGGLTRARTIALARAQQRRIAAALR